MKISFAGPSTIEIINNPLNNIIKQKTYQSTRIFGNVVPNQVPVQRLSRREGSVDDKVVKSDLAKLLKLHVRDLKPLDDTGGNRVFASIHAHDNAIVLSFEGVRLLIQQNEVILFSPDADPSVLFSKALLTQFDEFTALRFEHEVFETALNAALLILLNEFTELSKFVEEIFSTECKFTETEQIIRQAALFPKKTKLQVLRKRVAELTRVLSAMQSDDTQLGQMFLGGDSSDSRLNATNNSTSSTNPTYNNNTTTTTNSNNSSSISSNNNSNNNSTPPISSRSISISRNKSNGVGFSNVILVNDDNSQRHGTGNSPDSFMRFSDVGAYRLSNVDGDDEAFRPSISMRAGKGGMNYRSGGGVTGAGTASGSSQLAKAKKRLQSMVPSKLRDTTFDVELIIDNALITLGWLESDIDDLIDRLIALEAETALQVDIVRNRIMRYNIYLTISTFSVALVALVPGIFGMNLLFPSKLYDDIHVFYWTVAMIAVCVPLVCLSLITFGKQIHVL